MSRDDGFLSRWSRLKRTGDEAPARRRGSAAPRPPGPLDRSVPAVPPVQGSEPRKTEEPPSNPPPPDLPSVEGLTYQSDYTAFLHKEVPDALRKQALRKLWTSDPLLANLDGLFAYGEDFTGGGVKPGEVIRTLYQVGKGMPDPGETEPEAETAAEDAEPPGTPPDDAETAGKSDSENLQKT